MPSWFRLLYSLLWVFALPFALSRLLWRARGNREYRQHWGERLGFGELAHPPSVWIHAVSVGEARATVPLANALIKSGQRLLITCTTPTGRAALKELYGNTVAIRYLPFDAPWLVGRFLSRIRPNIAVLMETEVWPGLCDACARRRVPLWLVNARMSERSMAGYLRGGSLSRAMFRCLAGIAAQTKVHAERFERLGGINVHAVGNMKFDLSPSDRLQFHADAITEHITGGAPSTPYWVAGSTREGEEALLLQALQKHPLRRRATAVIVPRHPERWQSSFELAQKLGFRVAKRSSNEIFLGCEVIIGDSMGEMLAYYANAKAALMGGTFGNTGGQNLIEPCAVGVPVVLGPSVFNFQQAADEAVAAGAAQAVPDVREAFTTILAWLDDEPKRRQASQAASAFVAAHRGATHRTLALLQLATRR